MEKIEQRKYFSTDLKIFVASMRIKDDTLILATFHKKLSLTYPPIQNQGNRRSMYRCPKTWSQHVMPSYAFHEIYKLRPLCSFYQEKSQKYEHTKAFVDYMGNDPAYLPATQIKNCGYLLPPDRIQNDYESEMHAAAGLLLFSKSLEGIKLKTNTRKRFF